MKKKWSLFYILILLSMFSCSKDDEIENINLRAEENFVELSFAKKIAGEIYFENKPNSINVSKKGVATKPTKRNLKTTDEYKNKIGKTSFYVINYVEGGFIILSADKRTQPILGFSSEGEFNVNEDFHPFGLKFWIKDTKKRITDVQNSSIVQSDNIKRAWVLVKNALANPDKDVFAKEPKDECEDYTFTTVKGPLLNTKWYQQGGFNTVLPFYLCSGINVQMFAGCAPIAMAQVMKYHEFPTSYNWSLMPNDYGTTTTANFISDIHNAIGNVYAGEPYFICDVGTGVSHNSDMGSVLKSQFNYSNASLSDYDYETVQSEIDYNRPVILSGSNSTSGHMWVCDGYRQTTFQFEDCSGGTYYPLFHMNWGWGSNYDGWFSYNNFNPSTTHYNNNKKMIYNITP